MTSQLLRSMALVTAGMMAAATADAASSRHNGAQERRDRERVRVIAAMQPVGAATGWGRIKVEDRTREDKKSAGTRRKVEVTLFDLEPMTRYTIQIDDVVIGTVATNSFGDATREFASPDDSHPPVPAELPAAAALGTAWVLDPSLAAALEGRFADVITSGGGGGGGGGGGTNVHEERISLDPGNAGRALGMAKVERSSDGKQEFETMATNLAPGASYRIAVDSFAAGIVIADAVGQASLELQHPDDSNPLPFEMRPIESLRSIEWIDGRGDVVLKGSFTGTSNDDRGDDNGDDDDDDDDDGDDDDDDDDDGDDVDDDNGGN